MPANLPPNYFEAEKRYREAQSPEEKVEILEEMLSIMPKHKGTDRLRGDLRRKISKLKAESQKKKEQQGRKLPIPLRRKVLRRLWWLVLPMLVNPHSLLR